MPQGVRARALYMGSMYRIGFEALLAFGVTSLSILGWAATGAGDGVQIPPGMFWVAVAVIAASPLWPLTIFVLRQNRRLTAANQTGNWVATRRALAKAARRVQTDLGSLALAAEVVVLFGTALLAAFTAHRFLVLAGASFLASHWALRFVFGRGPTQLRKRFPVAKFTSSSLFAAAALPLIFVVKDGASSRVFHSAPDMATWLGVTVVTSVLIIANGHARRLKGAYTTQRRWFALNDVAISKVLKVDKRRMPRTAPPVVFTEDDL
jgi:hypothetical protein